MTTFRTILHPSDFSRHSQQALQLASALAREYHSRLILLHVYQTTGALRGDLPSLLPEADDLEEALLKKLCSLPRPEGSISVEHYVKEGEPAAEILRLARDNHCDLIVMGTHGASGLNRVLTGSVAEEVLRKAPCPVVTISPAHGQ